MKKRVFTPQDDKIGSWLSAALSDDNVCKEMKEDIRAWFAQFDNFDYQINCFAIPHPGTGEMIENISFDDAMEKWFEGFNIPRMRLGEEEFEDFSVSCERVKAYFNKRR